MVTKANSIKSESLSVVSVFELMAIKVSSRALQISNKELNHLGRYHSLMKVSIKPLENIFSQD
jgi:hypothetical protein